MLNISKGRLVVQNIVKKTFDSILKIIKYIFAFFLYERHDDHYTLHGNLKATCGHSSEGEPPGWVTGETKFLFAIITDWWDDISAMQEEREKDRKAVPRSRSHVFPPVSAICYTDNCLDHPRLDPFKDRIKLSNPQYDNSRMHCAK